MACCGRSTFMLAVPGRAARLCSAHGVRPRGSRNWRQPRRLPQRGLCCCAQAPDYRLSAKTRQGITSGRLLGLWVGNTSMEFCVLTRPLLYSRTTGHPGRINTVIRSTGPTQTVGCPRSLASREAVNSEVTACFPKNLLPSGRTCRTKSWLLPSACPSHHQKTVRP